MANAYKRFKENGVSIESIEVNKNWNLSNTSDGIKVQGFTSTTTDLIPGVPVKDNQNNYYDSLRINFYASASYYSTEAKYRNQQFNLGLVNDTYPQHLNKFYNTGSIISIAQRNFGEEIKRNSFTLTDNSSAKEIIIKDDGHGNLYSSNTHHSQSSVSHISSSENYIGNIFYNTGLITITETGSWSGSGTANGIDYTVVGTGTFNINFKSTQTLYVRSFEIDIDPTEFLGTNNPTIRQKTTEPGTEASSSVLGTPFTIPEITTGASGSKWAPYMTTVGFYDANKQLVMVGRYPQPIKMRDDMKLILKIQQDF